VTPQSQFCASIGIDHSALSPVEVRPPGKGAAPDAAERGERPARRDAPAKAGAREWHCAPDTAYFLKLIDESSGGITIIKTTTTVGVEELRALITGGLERDSALAALTGDDGKREPLDAETLRLGRSLPSRRRLSP
jgi:hypothetical protein